MTDRTSSSTAGCNSPMTESMESERPAFTSEHRHQCLRCTAHSIGHQIIVKWSPSRFSLRDYPSSPRIHKINVKIFRQILFFIKIQKLSENQTAGDNSYLGTSHFVGFWLFWSQVVSFGKILCVPFPYHRVSLCDISISQDIYLLEKEKPIWKPNPCKDSTLYGFVDPPV